MVFQLAVSYESCMEKDTGNASNADCNGGTIADYDDDWCSSSL